jgi:hypothetical protein
MANNAASRRRSWRSRVIMAATVVLAMAWTIDHRGCIRLVRPSDSTQRREAFIHQQPSGEWVITSNPENCCGRIVHVSLCSSIDERVFATDIAEWRWLSVQINGRQLDRHEVETWRSRAAAHFLSPAILAGDVDRTQRVWMGYPLEIVGRAMLGALCLLPVVLFIGLLWLVSQASREFDHAHRRRALLRRNICPQCRYSLIGLPEPRCPECGERWTVEELQEAIAHQQRAPA